MAQDGPAVRMAPPSDAVLRVLNPLVRALVGTPLGRALPGFGVIAYRGRRSGREFRTPVGVHEVDGTPYLFTEGSWRLNFTGGVPARLTRRGSTVVARATLLDLPPDEVGALVRLALDQGASRRVLGIAVRRGHEPTPAELGALGQSAVRIDLGVTS